MSYIFSWLVGSHQVLSHPPVGREGGHHGCHDPIDLVHDLLISQPAGSDVLQAVVRPESREVVRINNEAAGEALTKRGLRTEVYIGWS